MPSLLESSVPMPGTRAYAVVEKMEAARIQRERTRRAQHHAAAVLLQKWRQRILRKTRKRLQHQLLYLFLLRKYASRAIFALRSAARISRRIRDASRNLFKSAAEVNPAVRKSRSYPAFYIRVARQCKAVVSALIRNVGYKRLLWAAGHQYKPKRIGWTAFIKRIRDAIERRECALQLLRGAAAYHENVQKGKGLTVLRKCVARVKEIREYLSHHDAYYLYMVLKRGFESFLSKIRPKIRARKVSGVPQLVESSQSHLGNHRESNSPPPSIVGHMCKYAWRRWMKFVIIPKMRERVAMGVAILKAYARAFRRLRQRALNSSRRRLGHESMSYHLFAKKFRNKKGAKVLIIVLRCRMKAIFHHILNRILDRHRNAYDCQQREQKMGWSCVCRAWRLWRAKHIARRRAAYSAEAFESLAGVPMDIHVDSEYQVEGAGEETRPDIRNESESQAEYHYVTTAKKRFLNRWIQCMAVRCYYHKLYKQADRDNTDRLRTRAHRCFMQWSVFIRTAKGKYVTATAAKILASEGALKMKALTAGSSNSSTVSLGGIVSMATVKALKGSIASAKAKAVVHRSAVDGAEYFDNMCKSRTIKALIRVAWEARFLENCQILGNNLRLAQYLRKRWLKHFLIVQVMKESIQRVKLQNLRSKFRIFRSRLRNNSKSILRRKMENPAWRDSAFQTFHSLIMNVCVRKQRRDVFSTAITHGTDSAKYEALRRFVEFITRRRANQTLVERAVHASNLRICRVCFRAWAHCFKSGRETIMRGIALRSNRVLRLAVGRFKRMLLRRRKLKWMMGQGKRCHSHRGLKKALKIWVSWTFRSINNRDLLQAAQGNADFHSMSRYLRTWDKVRHLRVQYTHRLAGADSYFTDFRLRRTLRALWSRVRLSQELRAIPLVQQKRRQMQAIERTDEYGDSNDGTAVWQAQWQRFTSEEGYVYYYNDGTGESMWEDEFLAMHQLETADYGQYTNDQPYELDGYSDCALYCVKKQKFINRLRKICEMKHLFRQIARKRTQKAFDVWHQGAIYRHQAKFIIAVRSRLEWRFDRSRLYKSFRRWVFNYYPRSWIKRCASQAVIFMYRTSIKRWRRNLRFLSHSHSFTDAVCNRNRYAAANFFFYKAGGKALHQFITFVKKAFVTKHVQSVSDEIYASRGLRALTTVWKRFAIRRHREKRRNRKLNRYYLKYFCRRVLGALQMLVAMQWARRQRVRLVSLYYRKQALGRALRQMSKNVRANQIYH